MPSWITPPLVAVKRRIGSFWKWLWPLRIGPHIAVMISAAIALAFGIGCLFGIKLPTETDQTARTFDGVKLVLTVVAGIGGIVALTVAYRKQRLGESTERRLEAADTHAQAISDSNEAREQSKHFHERFGAATEQLGSERANIRSAGAYALAHLADDWDDGRQTCINVLCNYIRMPYTAPREPDDIATPEALARNELQQQERQVRHTILAIIGERLRVKPVPGKTWHSHDYDFTDATIDGGNFRGAKFTGGIVRFTDAKFIGGDTYFNSAEFAGGIVHFGGARFMGGIVRFTDAKFAGGIVYFGLARFMGGTVRFSGARFMGGILYFDGARFMGGIVHFTDAKFAGGRVRFDGARFMGGTVHFSRARFSDGIVHFSRAELKGGHLRFDGSEFTGGTVDFRLASAWSRPPLFDDFPDGPPQGLLLPER